MILVICSAYSFLGNASLCGISPYIILFSMEFDVDTSVASTLISYPNLAFGFGEPLEPPPQFTLGPAF